MGVQHLVDDGVQGLLDGQFAMRPEVGASGPAFRHDLAVGGGQQGHGLAAAGVDSQYPHAS